MSKLNIKPLGPILLADAPDPIGLRTHLLDMGCGPDLASLILASPPCRADVGPMSGKTWIQVPVESPAPLDGLIQDIIQVGRSTGRWSATMPNQSAWPQHEHRGRWECKVEFRIALEKRGRSWRMSGRNRPWRITPGHEGLDPRPFASREAALKYCRKLWRGARVELASWGLSVTLFLQDMHLCRAIEDRTRRKAAKLKNYQTVYDADFGELERRCAASMLAFGNAHVEIQP